MEQASEVDIAVGHKVQLLRIEQKIRIEDLAKFIGISLDEYKKYEAGQSRFSPGVLIKLCKVLKIKPSRIFTDLSIN